MPSELDILIDIRARLQNLDAANKQLLDLTQNAKGLGDAVKTGFGIDIGGKITNAALGNR